MIILRTDNGREYHNRTLKETLDKYGIEHETSIAYNPQSNGGAERTKSATGKGVYAAGCQLT